MLKDALQESTQDRLAEMMTNAMGAAIGDLLHDPNVEELRETSKSHVIISVSEAISRVRDGKILTLSPLCGGLPPEIAWPYLKRVGEVVLPQAAQSVPAQAAEAAGGGTLNEFFSHRES